MSEILRDDVVHGTEAGREEVYEVDLYFTGDVAVVGSPQGCLGLGTASGCGAVQMGEVERCLDSAKNKKERIFSTERSDIALKPAKNQSRHVEVVGM